MPATAIYTRISKDQRDGAGVARQLAECRRLAARQGWTPLVEFTDNDISASRYTRKVRPAYRAMVHEVRDGHLDRIVCWAVDRLYRQPKELEELIDLADAGRLQVASLTGELDLSNGEGRMLARVFVAVAAAESDRLSARVKAEKAQARAQRKPLGGRRVGWLDERTPDPLVAPHLCAAWDLILGGASLNDIARHWTALKVKGRVWTSGHVGSVLTRPHHAGLIVHKGEIVGEGGWTPLIERDKFERVLAVLRSRSRNAGQPRRRSLLTGTVFCGGCGKRMVRSTAARGGVRVFRCQPMTGYPACGRVTIVAEPTEAVAVEATFERVDRLDLAAVIAEQPRPTEYQDITRQLALLQEREDEAAQSFAAGRLSVRMIEGVQAQVAAERERLSARLVTISRQDLLAPYAGREGALRAVWDTLPLDQRRGIVRDALKRVTVLPARTRGSHRFDPARLVIGEPVPEPVFAEATWKGKRPAALVEAV